MEPRRFRAGSVLTRIVAVLATSIVLLAVWFVPSSGASESKLFSLLGTWLPTENKMNSPRFDAMTVTLPDGRVLIAGGRTYFGHGGPWTTDVVDTFNPATGKFERSGRLAGSRSGALTAPLPDGRVLFIGGSSCCIDSIPEAEIYDPATGTGQAFELSENVSARFGPLPEPGLNLSIAPLPSGNFCSSADSTYPHQPPSSTLSAAWSQD